MIGFTDVAMVAMLKKLFADDPAKTNPTVCWGPPEASRQSMSIGEKQSDTGIPGLAVFRTGVNPDVQRVNQSRIAGVGLPYSPHAIMINGTRPDPVPNPLPTSQQRILDYPMVVEYTVSAWAAALSDLNDIEREMWFSTRWKALQAVGIPTTDPNVKGDFRWFMSVQAPSYRQEIQDNTGKIVWYGLVQKYLVSSSWIHTKNTQLVLQIDINFYNGVTSGDDIPDNLLDSIEIDTTSTPPLLP